MNPSMNPSFGPFKYHVGIQSLAQIATRDDRVCVLNILGGESSEVTPVGHAWSGGNVVFGPASTLKMELGGTVRGAMYDALMGDAGGDRALGFEPLGPVTGSEQNYRLVAPGSR